MKTLEYWNIARPTKIVRCGHCLLPFRGSGKNKEPAFKYEKLKGTRFPTVHRECLVLLHLKE